MTLDSLSVSSCVAVKDLGVFIDFRLLFEGHVNMGSIFHIKYFSEIEYKDLLMFLFPVVYTIVMPCWTVMDALVGA